MKKLFFIVILFCGHISTAQTNSKIDTSNYYNYLSPKNLKGHRLTTNWLRLDDVVLIMLDELKRAGYDWLYDRTIYKLENGQHINISAYSRKNNIGFLYIEGHDMFPDKSHRNILFHKDNSHVNYVECEETYSGKADFVKIEKIPTNVFVLKEDCYFFQYTDNSEDDKVLVTKEIALSILRQDIRRYLSTAPKPKQ
ncbi:MAG: hypothetical protein QM802_24440 [Agriterribacter sp.]